MSNTKNIPVTIAVLAYNQEQYVQAAITAAFAQTYRPLQIILSDDGSTDATFTIMQGMADAYDGPHTITLNRNPKNLGIGGHINVIGALSTGMYIFAAAGDDVSLPDRVERCMPFLLKPGIYAISTDERHVTAEGLDLGVVRRPHMAEASIDGFMAGRHALGCTEAWSRAVLEDFAPLSSELLNEDVVLGIRALLLGKIEYLGFETVRRTVGVGVSERRIGLSRSEKVRHFTRARALWETIVGDLRKHNRDIESGTASKRLDFAESALALYQSGIQKSNLRSLVTYQGLREIARWILIWQR